MPQIDPLTKFSELIAQPFEGDKFIAHCQDSEEKILLRDAVTPARDTLILIGPEGDFSPAEIELAHKFRWAKLDCAPKLQVLQPVIQLL